MDPFPKPELDVIAALWPVFQPAHGVRDWAYRTFIDEHSVLVNPEHAHLRDASILFVWSSTSFKRQGKRVIGTAQLGQQQGSLGKKELLEFTYRHWNGGELPDFIITLSAPYCANAAPESICALVEHELLHCTTALDKNGMPQFGKRGIKYAMRGHDVEEFVNIVARYGPIDSSVKAMVEAAKLPPLIARTSSDLAVCGCGAAIG